MHTFWNVLTHHFRPSLFNRTREPNQSAFWNNPSVWTSTTEPGRQFARTDAARRNVLGVRYKCNRTQSKLRTKVRVSNTYQITAYRQFSAFVARIVFNNFFVISGVQEFKSPSGHQIDYFISIIYRIMASRDSRGHWREMYAGACSGACWFPERLRQCEMPALLSRNPSSQSAPQRTPCICSLVQTPPRSGFRSPHLAAPGTAFQPCPSAPDAVLFPPWASLLKRTLFPPARSRSPMPAAAVPTR
jgi:hypothetical protein